MLPLDNTIKYHHLLLKISLDNLKEYYLPEGYEFVFYKDGDEIDWINIEISAQELMDYNEGVMAWNEYYKQNKNDLYNRLIFIVDTKTKEKVATATSYYNTWTNNKKEAYLHWVAIKKEYQGLKLSKPLIIYALNNLKKLGYNEAFISTQTTTWLAAKIYLDLNAYPYDLKNEEFGFQILKGIIGNHSRLSDVNAINDIYDPIALKIKDELSKKYSAIEAFKIYNDNMFKIVKIKHSGILYEFKIDLNKECVLENFILVKQEKI